MWVAQLGFWSGPLWVIVWELLWSGETLESASASAWSKNMANEQVRPGLWIEGTSALVCCRCTS